MTAPARLPTKREISRDRRRQRVAGFMAQCLSIEEIRQLITKPDPTGAVVSDPATGKARPVLVPAWSYRAIEEDVAWIRAQHKGDIGSMTAQDYGAVIRRDTEAMTRQLWQMFWDAGQLRPADRVRARVSIVREIRAQKQHELDAFQTLGIVYKAPMQVQVRQRMFEQFEGLSASLSARIAAATTEAELMAVVTEAFGSEVAREFLALPAGTEIPAAALIASAMPGVEVPADGEVGE